MVSDVNSTSDARVPLEILADEFQQRRKRGEVVPIEEYAAKYPDLADEIHEVFSALESLESLTSNWKRSVQLHTISGPTLPFQLGEYLLEREIGRGGMGIVYEAQHRNLRRPVAIKLLSRFSLGSGTDVERFHREARAAGALHHTNIVPVFDFGEFEGYHFIAMQLIGGAGLDAVLESLRQQKQPRGLPNCAETTSPTVIPEYGSSAYWNYVATIGVQAANALDYAHSHGTVHRDVKPGNLLLDANCVVWVADFGLARQTQDGKPTQSGILSGTLRYLAPEQFHGRCDELTDQYGLGLSLYELVTLQPAAGDSGSHAEIMRRITHAKVIPPRHVNPAIPRDLETIILKSIAAEPANRFASCRALADDLIRFSEGRPITARPVTVAERCWRWSKRNPALATSLAMCAALLISIAVVATVGYRAELQQRRRAESTTTLAVQALDNVFKRFTLPNQSSEFLDNTALPTPVLTKDSAAMLANLLPIFDRLAEMDDQSEDIRLRAVAARKRVGDIEQKLGHFTEAIAAYKLAIHGYKQRAHSGTDEINLQVANIFNEIGTCQLMLGQQSDSRRSHATALQNLETLPSIATPELQFQLARTHYLLTRELRPGQSPMTVDAFSQRLGDSGAFGPDGGPPPRRPGMHSTPAIREHLDAAIRVLQPLCDDSTGEPRLRHLLATCLRASTPDDFSGATPAEVAADSRALRILEKLMSDYPDIPEYGHSLIDALAGIDTHHRDAIHEDDLDAAEQRLRHALKVGKRLIADHRYVPEYCVSVIHTHNKLAHVLERRASIEVAVQRTRLNEAMNEYQAATELQQGLVTQFPEAASYGAWLEEFRGSQRRLETEIAELGVEQPLFMP